MKVFILVSTILAVVGAKPSGQILLPAVRSPIFVNAPLETQYHAQDSFGQYNFGYANDLSSKQEVRSLDGITRGAYSYVDPEGKLQSVDYTADALNGFRVTATNLPKAPKALPVPEQILPLPVAETPEVAEARAVHLAAIDEAKNRKPAETLPLPKINIEDLPKQVEDTPEVAHAKAAHLAAKKDAELRHQIISDVHAVAPLVPTLRTAEVSSLPILPTFRTAELQHGGFSYGFTAPVWNHRLLPSPYFNRIVLN